MTIPTWLRLPLFIALPTLWIIYATATTDFNFDLEAAKQVNKTQWQWAFSEGNWWYEWINLATIIFPFLLSFDRRVHFYTQWRHVFPAIAITATFFILWDVYFTHLGVWGFNARYTGGMFLGLPYGEWLFFFTVPYACLFIYACMEAYFSDTFFKKIEPVVTPILLIILITVGIFNLYRAYTAWTFLLSAAFLAYHYWYVPNDYRGRFYQAYLVCLIPFLLVNGILTGSVNQEPVVLYNDAHNLTSVLHSRLITIPWDDFAYCLLLLIVNVTIYEALRKRG